MSRTLLWSRRKGRSQTKTVSYYQNIEPQTFIQKAGSVPYPPVPTFATFTSEIHHPETGDVI